MTRLLPFAFAVACLSCSPSWLQRAGTLTEPIEFRPWGEPYRGAERLEDIAVGASALVQGEPVPVDGVFLPTADLDALRREHRRLKDTIASLERQAAETEAYAIELSRLQGEQIRDCRRRVAEAFATGAGLGAAGGVVADDVIGAGLGR